MDAYTKGVGTFVPDNLFFDTKSPVDTKAVVLKSGQGTLKRGTVLGIITATKLAVPVDSTKADGSQTPDSILTDDTDTTAGNTTAVAYSSGTFNRNALIFGGTDTAATANHELTLRQIDIKLKTNIPY